jgi:hypothetical protein
MHHKVAVYYADKVFAVYLHAKCLYDTKKLFGFNT